MQGESEKDMTGLKKQRNKNHWTLPYVYAGRRSEVHIWLIEDENSSDFGRYHVYCGAVARMADTFDDALVIAQEFTHGGLIL